MFALILFFLVSYITYFFILLLGTSVNSSDLIIAFTFFFGSVFVWITNKIAVKTILDVRRVARLKAESITDPLTGIFNRRYFFRRLSEEVEKSKRYHSPLSLVMFDIDHFKLINDTYGHLAGDKVLAEVCKAIQESVRKIDFVARYGGEEICILMPNTKVTKAKSVAERIRKKMEELEIYVEGEELKLKVTLSAGISSLSETDSPELLIRKADVNLYKAKQNGRNQVVIEAREEKENQILTKLGQLSGESQPFIS